MPSLSNIYMYMYNMYICIYIYIHINQYIYIYIYIYSCKESCAQLIPVDGIFKLVFKLCRKHNKKCYQTKSIKDLLTLYIPWSFIYIKWSTESFYLSVSTNMYLHSKMFFILHLYWTFPCSWNSLESSRTSPLESSYLT